MAGAGDDWRVRVIAWWAMGSQAMIGDPSDEDRWYGQG